MGVRALSSDHLACPAMPEAGGGKADDASEGHGNRVRFACRSPMASELVASFLGVGTSLCLSASCPPLTNAGVGSQRSIEVVMTLWPPSSSEVLTSPPSSVGSFDSSSASTSLQFSPTYTHYAMSISFPCFL